MNAKDAKLNERKERRCIKCEKRPYGTKRILVEVKPDVFLCSECIDVAQEKVYELEQKFAYSKTKKRSSCSCGIEAENSQADADNASNKPESKSSKSLKELLKYLDKHVIGQDEIKQTLTMEIIDHITRVESGIKGEKKANTLLIGAPGVGKTTIIKAIAKYLEIPIIIEDATSFTERGYHGRSVDKMLLRLRDEAPTLKDAERGIICIDEIDKLVKSEVSDGRDVSGIEVQKDLLKLIEGDKVPCEVEQGWEVTIDTTNILFIGLGAFEQLDKVVEKRLGSGIIGFGQNSQVQSTKDVNSILQQVLPEDIINYGYSSQFIGRFPRILTLETLTTDLLVRIIKEPENSILNQYISKFKRNGVELIIEEDAFEAIAEQALKLKTGARALEGVFINLLDKARFKTKIMDNYYVKCIVTADVANNKRQPILIPRTSDKDELEVVG